jgi:hypothetical protein
MNEEHEERDERLAREMAEELVRKVRQRESVPPRLYPTLLDETMNFIDFKIGGPSGGPYAPAIKVVNGGSALSSASDGAHRLYIEGLMASGGREGMIAALEIVCQLLHRVPELQNLAEPLEQLQTAMIWAAEGITHPAVKVKKASNRPKDPLRHEFALRCVMALFACRDAGRQQPARDVCHSAKSAAMRFFPKDGCLSGATLETYEAKHGPESRKRLGSDLLLWSLALEAKRAETDDERKLLLELRAKILLECLEESNLFRDVSAIAGKYVGLQPITKP